MNLIDRLIPLLVFLAALLPTLVVIVAAAVCLAPDPLSALP